MKKFNFKAIKFSVRKLIFRYIPYSVNSGIIDSFLVKEICARLLGSNYCLNFLHPTVQPFWSCMHYIEIGNEYSFFLSIPVLAFYQSWIPVSLNMPPPPPHCSHGDFSRSKSMVKQKNALFDLDWWYAKYAGTLKVDLYTK